MYIIAGSVTAALRLKKELEKATGYPAEVVHTPSQINSGGCSYSVKADERLIDFISPFCKERNIPVKKIYSEEFVNGERVFNAVS